MQAAPDPAAKSSTASVGRFDPRFHLASIVESSEDAIISKDLDGLVMTWNRAAERIFGYSAEEMIGQSILMVIPRHRHQEEVEILKRLRSGERIEHFETVRLRRTGEEFAVAVTISPLRDDSNQIIGASKIARDISEKKMLDESRARLAAIVDSADDAIVSKDLNGIVKTWNEGARRMFGYTAEEMIGRPVLQLIPHDLQYEEDLILAKLRNGERIQHYETNRRKKSGEIFEVSVTISPIRDTSGKVIGASKIARDISSRRRVERLLVQSEKLAATGRMAATIAHEINNPLESLMNLIYLAREEAPAGSASCEYLRTAEEEIQRISHLARQTLGYYRDTSKPAPAFMHDLISNVLTVYHGKLLSCGVTAVTNFEDQHQIVVSRGEILQVISNIMANAIDATASGGTIEIRTSDTEVDGKPGVCITVQDNGTGISADNLERIFEPFFTTKGEYGTGIGLWVARQLVEKRSGTVSVESSVEPGDSGTRVVIFLPYAELVSQLD